MERLLAVSAMLALLYGVARLWAHRVAARTLVEAAKLGMDAVRIKRKLLTGLDAKLRPAWCIQSRFRLSRRGAHSWRLLQRPGAQHAELPAGWLLEGLPAIAPRELRDAILQVTKEWEEGLIEIEVVSNELSMFWDDHGGKAEAETVLKAARRLVAALEQQS